MPYFYYRATNFAGETVSGIIEATDKSEAIEKLSSISLVPERVIRIPSFIYFLIKHIFSAPPYMSPRELIDFLKSVGIGIKAGIPLLELLISIQEEMTSRRAKAAVREIIQTLSAGGTFSQALKKLKFVPSIVIAFAEIGEETGNLADNLIFASQRLEFIETVKSQVKSASIYPIISFTVVMASLFVWIYFVIPKVSVFLYSLGLELPVYTLFLLNLSKKREIILYYFLGIFGGILISYFLLKFITKKFGKGHILVYLKDKIKMKIPILGKFIKEYNLFLLASFMSSLLRSGCSIERMFSILRSVIDNAVFYRAINEINERVNKGESLTEAFRNAKIFPPFFLRYMAVGEKTGTLDEQLEIVAQFYKEKLDRILSTLPKLIEPIMIALIGIITLSMIMAVFYPIYSQIGKILGKGGF
ncbi:MAG TPA: type II secretion system F family protein [Aquificae bacterium]|nr:type II secretion system F family protein [Aquificota bacterium]